MIVACVVCVESCTGTDSTVNGVPKGVVYRKVYYKIVETLTCGVAKMLSMNALVIIPRSVSIETCSRANSSVNGIPQGVVHAKVNYQIMETACQTVAQVLCIYSATIVFYSVSVESCSGTYCSVNGVSQSVVHIQVYNKIVEQVCDTVAKMLCINALMVVRLPVGVERSPGTYCTVDGIPQSVVHYKVYYKIVVAPTCGILKVLSKNALQIILVAVGIETHSGSDGSVNRIPKCVVYCKVDNKVVETS